MHADHGQVTEQRQVPGQRDGIHVYHIEATCPEKVKESPPKRRRVEGEDGVDLVEADAAQVVPRQAPNAVLLRYGERLDIGQGRQSGQALSEVLRNRPSFGPTEAQRRATIEAERRHVERARQQPQHMEAADRLPRIRRIGQRRA